MRIVEPFKSIGRAAQANKRLSHKKKELVFWNAAVLALELPSIDNHIEYSQRICRSSELLLRVGSIHARNGFAKARIGHFTQLVHRLVEQIVTLQKRCATCYVPQ